MSQLNINDLPREMLIKIFRMLDGFDMKRATLACKLWKNLIESGCRWSVSLWYHHQNDYVLLPRDVQRMNFILTTKRRLGKIEIRNGSLSEDNQMLEIFRRQGFNVVQLRLFGCRIYNRAVFTQLIKLTPNLEALFINYYTNFELRNVTDVPLDPVLPELKKLKILEIPESPIIECFRNAKLTTVCIWQDGDYEDMEAELSVDFVLSQPTLTSLTIKHCKQRSILVEMGKLDVPIPFRLTQLGIVGRRGINSSQDHDNLRRFIESQAESLKEMCLEGEFPTVALELAFASLTKLRTLKLSLVSLDYMPLLKNPDFYDRLKENRSVCTIALASTTFDFPWLGKILNRLPNIRSLILLGYYISLKESSMAVMAQNLGRLESLSIGVIQSSIGYVKFANLRKLRIGNLEANINWNELTKANSQLVELIIESIDTRDDGPLLTSDDIDQITTNVDLQYLRLGDGFVADDRFFEIIRTKCTNLKVLELYKSCVPRGLRPNVEINVFRLYRKYDYYRKLHYLEYAFQFRL